MTEQNEDLLPLHKACKVLDMAYPSVQYRCRTRKLVTRTIRGRKYIDRRSLEAYREYLVTERAARARLLASIPVRPTKEAA
jgi:hypothetical protein